MFKKTLIALLFGTSFIMSSCIDNNYDLAKKEITTDVKVEGNTIALPVGSLKPIVLGDLVNIDEIEMLEKNGDGVYCISMSDSISVEESIDQIVLNIDPIKHEVPIEFDEVNIEDVSIEAATLNNAKFAVPSISLDELNSKLPRLTSRADGGFVDTSVIEEAKKYFDILPEDKRVIGIENKLIEIKDKVVECKFTYSLPEQVEKINSITLGSEKDPNGTLVNVVITHPKALKDVEQTIAFDIDFPDNFHLSATEYDVDDENSIISVEGLKAEGETTTISFYITKLCDIDGYISNGQININEEIKYNIAYTANGSVKLTKDMEASDFAFNVELDTELSFLDVAGVTKAFKVEFTPISMNFSADIDKLEYIKEISYVEFDKDSSHIKFSALLNDHEWLNTFGMEKGYALRISFPDQLDICEEESSYNGKEEGLVCYDADERSFYVYDLAMLINNEWDLAIERLTLNLPVINDSCHIPVDAEIRIVDPEKNPVDSLTLSGVEMESMVKVLDDLYGKNGVKKVEFAMGNSNLKVKDAVVLTDFIRSSLNTNTSFSINEKIPNEIGRIEKIGFSKDVEMTLCLDVKGLDDLKTDIGLDIKMNLPSFLKLRPSDTTQGVSINNGVLSINSKYDPSSSEPLKLKLICTGLDFMNEEFGYAGLLPKEVDGESYISYNTDIVVEGDASIEGTEFHSTVLNNDIAFNVEFEVDEIAVKSFHGLYNASIEGVEDKVDLDLGDEFAFLREDGNSITLADPQLEFVLKNTIGIPVDINLEIFGNDENGVVISDTEISKILSIKPAEYDENSETLTPVETKLFITTDASKIKKAGYENVEIPNLANMLKKIPYSLNFKVEPIIRTDETHHVDISEPIKLDADYSVVIPLKFADFHMCYNDTIEGLQIAIGETFDMFSNISLSVKMDVLNTIPLGLKLNVVPLDADGKVLEDIEIDELRINAGLGEDVVNNTGVVGENTPEQQFVFAIKSKRADVSALDKLAISIEAASDESGVHTVGAVGLKGGQGIKLSNIVFEVSGDVEIELGK